MSAKAKLSQRIAEEAQLLAEEKWIIDSLKKIKAQRNALQIERLHLESTRSKLLASRTETDAVSTEPVTAPKALKQEVAPMEVVPTVTSLDDNGITNTEELNLSVTNSVFNVHAPFHTGSICDEEEDEEDMDDCVLDMDLLMNGKERVEEENDI